MADDIVRCELCGEPMPPGEEMFKYHGYSCDCPKAPKPKVADDIAAIRERMTDDELARHYAGRWAPVQGFTGGIPWDMHLRAYNVCCEKYSGRQRALIDLDGRNCRGGFHADDLDRLIPGWRDELSEHKRLSAEIDRLRAELEAEQRKIAEAEGALWRVPPNTHTIFVEGLSVPPDPFEGPGETYRAAYERVSAELEAARKNARTPGMVEVCPVADCPAQEIRWDGCPAASCPIRTQAAPKEGG